MLMSREKGLREGNGNGGMHVGSHFFVLELPVALARVSGKIAIRQRLEHTSGVSQTHKHQVWRPGVEVSDSVNPVLGVQPD